MLKDTRVPAANKNYGDALRFATVGELQIIRLNLVNNFMNLR